MPGRGHFHRPIELLGHIGPIRQLRSPSELIRLWVYVTPNVTSIFLLFSYRVRGRCVRSPSSNHLSRSCPTVALVRSNLPDATSVTRAASALDASRSVPAKVRVACRELPVTGSYPLKTLSCQ